MIGKNRERKYSENVAFAESDCIFFALMCTRETRCRILKRESGVGVNLALREAALKPMPTELGIFPEAEWNRVYFLKRLCVPNGRRGVIFIPKGMILWIPLKI